MKSRTKLLALTAFIVLCLVVTPAFAHKTYRYTPSGIWVPQYHASSEAPHENTGPLEGASELARCVLNALGGLLGG